MSDLADASALAGPTEDGQTFSVRQTAGRQIVGWAAIALIVIAVVLGGGGSSTRPSFEAVCQLGGFVLLAAMFAVGEDRPLDPAAKAWIALAMLAFLLPLVQLVPLPSSLSAALPGHELANAIRAEAGAVGASPLSLDPDRTILAALSLVPGIALFVATLRSDAQWRARFIAAWIGLGVLAVLVGTLQVASSGDAAQLYDTAHRDAAIGFFANRNHEGIFLTIVLLLFVATLTDQNLSRRRAASLMRTGLIVLLIAGIFITRSRAAILLLALALPTLAMVLGRGRLRFRLGWPIVAAASVVLSGLAWFVFNNPVARGVMARFSFVDDGRWDYWPDVVFTLGQFWPTGSGFGTFQAVFATQERLGTIDDRYLNHAHNEYLELAIEGGVAAVALVAIFAVLLVIRFRAVTGWQGRERYFALTGGIAIVAVMVHSLVDYPLRAITMMAMFGFLAGLMFPPAEAPSPTESD